MTARGMAPGRHEACEGRGSDAVANVTQWLMAAGRLVLAHVARDLGLKPDYFDCLLDEPGTPPPPGDRPAQPPIQAGPSNPAPPRACPEPPYGRPPGLYGED